MIVQSIHLKLKDKNEENVQKVRQMLLDSQAKTSGTHLTGMTVGTALFSTPCSYDIALTLRFTSLEEAWAYADCCGQTWQSDELKEMIADMTSVFCAAEQPQKTGETLEY